MDGQATPVSDRSSTFRPELEGLRAVAILLVAASHLWWGRISGGIDVFLVVSGYLITVTLLGRWVRTGRVGADRYLARLAVRLLPAVLLVVSVSIGGALWLAADGRVELATSIFADAAAAAAFVENWHIAATTEGYLAADRVLNPVEQTWALSLQGQFYLGWLVLLLLAALLVRGTRQSEGTRRRWALVFVTEVMITSLGWSMVETIVDQPRAYLDPLARIWEFGVGGLLALVGARVIPGRVLGTVLGWIGLAMIVGLGFIGDFSLWFPGFASLWPVAGTVLVLLGANARAYGPDRLLGSRPAVWLGGLAFGIYLWHWPIISGFAILEGRRSFDFALGLAVVAVALIAAWLMKQLVERPIQRIAYGSDLSLRVVATVLLLASAALAVTASGFAASLTDRGDARAQAGVLGGVRVATVADAFAPTELSAAIESAISATTRPTVDEVPGPDARVERLRPATSCLNADPAATAECELGEPTAPYLAVILGDSNALSWHPALEGALGPEWRVRLLTAGDCPAVTVRQADSELDAFCREHRDGALAQIAIDDPDLVVLSSSSRAWDRLASGATGEEAAAEWEGALESTLDDLADADADAAVVVVAPAPPGQRECLDDAFDDGDRCLTTLSEAWQAQAEVESRTSSTVGAGYIDSRAWFCTPEGRCPWAIDGTLVRADSVHITQRFSERLALVLRAGLLATDLDLPPLARILDRGP